MKSTKPLYVYSEISAVPFDLFPLRRNRQGTTGWGARHTHPLFLFPWVSGISGNNRIQGTTECKPSSRFCCEKTATAAKDSEEFLK